MIFNGNANCASCGMDMGYPPEDADPVLCGHCQWGDHECPDGQFGRVVRAALRRIQDHEAEWLEKLQDEVPSYNPDINEASDDETGRMDEIQADQAFEAQHLLLALMEEFERTVA